MEKTKDKKFLERKLKLTLHKLKNELYLRLFSLVTFLLIIFYNRSRSEWTWIICVVYLIAFSLFLWCSATHPNGFTYGLIRYKVLSSYEDKIFQCSVLLDSYRCPLKSEGHSTNYLTNRLILKIIDLQIKKFPNRLS